MPKPGIGVTMSGCSSICHPVIRFYLPFPNTYLWLATRRRLSLIIVIFFFLLSAAESSRTLGLLPSPTFLDLAESGLDKQT